MRELAEGRGVGATGAVLLSVVIWVLAFTQAFNIVGAEPGGDLRNRVAGARRMMAGINPYLPPQAPLPEFYRSYTPTSAPPTHLLLYFPLAKLSYASQRWLYFAQDWVFLFFVLLLLLAICAKKVPRWWTLFACSMLLVFDASVLIHFARGQLYIDLLLLTSLVGYGMARYQAAWFVAIALTLLILLRPTYLLLVLAIALLRMWKLLRRTTIALAVLAVLVIAFTGPDVWRDYFSMLKRTSTDHLAIATGTWKPAKIDPIIEGRDYSQFHSFAGWEADRTFLGLFGLRELRSFAARHNTQLIRLNFFLLALSLVFALGLVWRMRNQATGLDHIAMLMLVPIIAETFGPQRYAYADVLLALPLVLAAVELQRRFNYCWIIVAGYPLVSRLNLGATISVFRFGLVISALLASLAYSTTQRTHTLAKAVP